MAKIAEGQTWFDTHKKSFVDVPITAKNSETVTKDDGIGTEAFLDAAESTATLFDLLGSVAFTPVKNDILGNVKKIRDRFNASPATSTTLQSLVKSELATKKHTATEGLVWLSRGLDFTATALRNDINTTSKQQSQPQQQQQQQQQAELADSFREGYKTTLARHHNFLVKPVFSAAMSAAPARKDFYAKMLGPNTEEARLHADEIRWLQALERNVKILNQFMASKEAKW